MTVSYSVGAYPDRRGQLPNAYPDRRTGRASQPGCGSRVWCTAARRPGVKPQEKNRDFRVFLLRVPKALASDGFWTILASTRRACLGPGRDGKVFCDSKLQFWSLPRSAWISPERLPRSAYPASRIGQCLDLIRNLPQQARTDSSTRIRSTVDRLSSMLSQTLSAESSNRSCSSATSIE